MINQITMQQSPLPKRNKRLIHKTTKKYESLSEDLDSLIFTELHTGNISLLTNTVLDYFYKNNIKSFYNYTKCIIRDMDVESLPIPKPVWFDYMICIII